MSVKKYVKFEKKILLNPRLYVKFQKKILLNPRL